jgi:apolipoprotein N-acyltransferase
MMPAATTRSILVCGLAGAVVPLAFAPFFWWWLAPASYAVLFLSWRNVTPKQAFARGWAFGFAKFLFGVYWITISVHEFGGAPIWIAVFLMLCLVSIMALYPAVVGWVVARWIPARGNWLWLGTIPALFVVAEWFRGWLFTGFGWLAPGYSQTETWLAGFAPLLGLLGVSWAVLLIAGGIALAVDGGRSERVTAGAVALALFGAGFVADQVAWTEPRSNRISVAMAQGAVPQELKWLPEQLPAQLNLYRDLTAQSLGSDLIIWPEAAIPEYYENFVRWLGEIERLAAEAGSHVMLGMLRFHPAGAQNAVFTLGRPEATYIKRHLVPYGEFFPMPDFLRPWIASMNLAFPDSQPGEANQPPIDLLGEKIAVTICYEDVFGAEQLHSFPEATLLVNVSNDGWFGDSIAAHQHLQIARMRSAEVRRWQLRTTNTGLTAVIDPFGQVSADLPQFETGILRANVTGVTGSTPYIFWGNYAVLLLAAAVISAYWARTKLTMRPGT